MKSFLIATFLLLASVLVAAAPQSAANAAGPTCSESIQFKLAKNKCTYSAKEVIGFVRSGDGHKYTVEALCSHYNQNGNCVALQHCRSNGERGTWYGVHRDGVGIGRVCLKPSDAQALGAITPEMVLRAFKRLSWPKAELVVQPPKGKTLVNFETLFYTDTPPPARQVVRLLGQRIVIEANPTSYLWHSTQGGETWSTTDPSRRKEPADDPREMNYFIYEKTGDYTPSVDVTYSGRYRVGTGPWQDIPGTLTVTGASQDLKVVEAVPVLVDPNG